ncbi:MHYT domain-containing protein [Pseudoalteromonas sp. XMcav1-K]|uniref:MHYT domain-containing protein n=1 Tax=Pseudoalteromonas sp. XMcav1-K TaxID=3374372 RepID=UPI0037566531
MLDWIFSHFSVPTDSLLIYGSYNPWLVTLSILIAIFASFMGLQVASQVTKTHSTARRHTMLAIGSIALGGGIWSMHFIGMLAFDLCTRVEYNGAITFLSMLPGIFASWVALNFINSHRKGFIPLLIGGVLVGAGIGTMHYTGMAAMEMAPLLRYEPWVFGLSIVVAVSLAMLSLWVNFGLAVFSTQGKSLPYAKVWSSIIMGCAITGMHYTGMAAARFVRPPGLELSEQTSEISIYLALGISITTAVIICLVLGLNMLYRYKDISVKAAESERRIRAMMDTAVDGIVSIDRSGTVLSINQATEELLGWSTDEIIGKNVNVLVPTPYHDNHDDYISRYLSTGQANIIGKGREVKARHKSGELVAIRLAIGHVKLSTNDFFVAFISDIRPRLRMEKALRENEEKFRSLITNIPGIAYRCKNTPEWPMMYISNAVQSITGYHAADFLMPNPKRSFSDLFHPDDKERIFASIPEQGAFSLEYRIINRDGEVRWVMEQGTHASNESTQDSWLDGFIMDITERKQMEQALVNAKESAEQAAAARASFMANMSHEIRTPMNAIIGFSDILLESDLQQEQQRHLTTINNSAKSLLHLLNDILDSAKLDKGKLELEIRDFSLVQEVDEVVSTLWLQARNKGIALNLNLDPKLKASYLGSPERIRQVLTNLVNNAIKFTQQGSVTLTVKPTKDNQVSFAIEDTGIGMTESQLQHVFDAFTQADSSMSRRFGGTGLGTTISKQLVELMGGEISATSTLDKGSLFYFTLPLAASTTANIKPLAAPSDEVKLPPLTILIVDDIQQNIELLSVLLSREGHTVITARDGKQALIRMASDDAIDLAIMDIQMPVMDGLTAATKRRATEQQQNLTRLPIIAFTASVLEADKQAAENAGMDGFANKPVDKNALFNEISRVLGLNNSITHVNGNNNHDKLIDDKKGIALWGSKTAYYHELSRFISEQQSAVELLSTHYKQQQWPELLQIAHGLKGVCGNLSLTQLMRKVELLESIICSHPEQGETILQQIDTVFNQVKQKVLAEQNEALIEQDNKHIQPQLLNVLHSLKHHAEHNEIDEQALSQLLALQDEHYHNEIMAISNAINDFDFALGCEAIEHLLNKLT